MVNIAMEETAFAPSLPKVKVESTEVCESATDKAEAALKWACFGFQITPTVRGSTEPALNPAIWRRDYSETRVLDYYKAHPEPDIAFTVGDRLICVVANSRQAEAVLCSIEASRRVTPTTIVKTPTGVEHYFWLDRGTTVAVGSVQQHAAHLELMTGNVIVSLPPYSGKVLVCNTACSTSDFASVDQAFINAVEASNCAPMQQSVAIETPVMSPPASSDRELIANALIMEMPEAPTDLPANADLVEAASVVSPESSATLSEIRNAVSTDVQRPRNSLDRFKLVAAEIERQLVMAVCFLGQLAMLGQFTLFYAPPNTGKTLIAFALMIESILRGVIDASRIYYINLDDTTEGLAQKVRIAEEYGINVLAEGFNGFSADKLLNHLNDMIHMDQCKDSIILLDTVKRAVDVMDKSKSASFTKVMRAFVLKGGTVVGLAHTNKNPGRDGKPVYGGTTDILDDCDCAYILKAIPAPAGSNEKYIEFTNIKRRGNVAPTAAYRYSVERDISYNELLTSVQAVDTEKLEPLKHAAEIQSDALVVGAIEACIGEGFNTKMRLADAAAERAGISRRVAMQVIEKYTGTDPSVHRWTFSVRDRGAKVFELITAP